MSLQRRLVRTRVVPARTMMALPRITSTPSILWIFVRYALIVKERLGIISFHTKKEGLKMFIHVLLGILTLSIIPYLALLLQSTYSSFLEKEQIRHLQLKCIGYSIIALHFSNMLLLPHPNRFTEYKDKKEEEQKEVSIDRNPQRNFIRTLSFFHTSNLQFMAMALSAIGQLLDDASQMTRLGLLTVIMIIYTFTIMVSMLEIQNVHWEQWNMAQTLFHILPHGMHSKSNLCDKTRQRSSLFFCATFLLVIGLGSVAIFQTLFQIIECIASKEMYPSPSKSVTSFFPILFLYVTAVNDAGFFLISQSSSEHTLSWVDWGDLILTQFLPLLMTCAGVKWLREEMNDESIPMMEFMRQHMLWTR